MLLRVNKNFRVVNVTRISRRRRLRRRRIDFKRTFSFSSEEFFL